MTVLERGAGDLHRQVRIRNLPQPQQHMEIRSGITDRAESLDVLRGIAAATVMLSRAQVSLSPVVNAFFGRWSPASIARPGEQPWVVQQATGYHSSLRLHSATRTAYVPSMRVHHHDGASRKGFAHARMFVASASRFSNRFGWKWL